MGMYDNMLPKEPKKGKIGYYPVTSKEEWDELPTLYKAMDWKPMLDYLNGHRLRKVEAVVFDVTFLEPYKVRAKVSVHPQEVQKILYCYFGRSECHLYSVCGIELEGGTVLPAKWYQDARTGAYEIVSCGRAVGTQGGYMGYIPKCIEKTDEGKFVHVWVDAYKSEVSSRYEISNPFR